MKKTFTSLLFISLVFSSWAQDKMANTFSILAIDPELGEMGGAVQSHYFSVPGAVLYAKAGVGIVATQALVNPVFGPNGLKLLEKGKSAQKAVEILVDGDEGQMYRQLAIVDAFGGVAQYTGINAIPTKCMIKGKNYTVQANMMLQEGVCKSMAEAYEKAVAEKKPMKKRLMDALFAAQNAGGDVRGMQSAGMVIVKTDANENPMIAKPLDLRVEDSKEPLKELQRLLDIHTAYDFMNQGDVAMEKGETDLAVKLYTTAQQLYPDNKEFVYWSAISLANIGKLEEAKKLLTPIFKEGKNWITLTYNLLPTGLLNLTKEQVDTLTNLD